MKKQEYSFSTGLLKTLKNVAIVLGPSVLAFLANVPPEYGVVAGFLAYLFKNWIENK